MKLSETNLLASTRSSLSDGGKARLLSAAQKGSSLWLQAIPIRKEYAMHPNEYEFAHRRLLGLPPVPLDSMASWICPCSEAVNLAQQPDHLDHCRALPQNLTRRHNYVQNTLNRLAQEAGMVTSTHPLLPHSNPRSSSFSIQSQS